MASTLTIEDGLSFCKPFIKQQSLFVNNQQPALGAAQIIINRLLGPPCVWRFNRFNFSIAISTAGGTDYNVTQPNLGVIETQWLTDGNGAVMELNGAVSLAKSGGKKRPTTVSPQYDDNAGNLVFRFNSIPDANYTANFDAQKKAPIVTGTASPIGISDEFAHLFYTGLLTWAGMLVNDSRFPIWEKDFIGGLLAAQDGLNDQAKAILVGDWMNLIRTMTRTQGLAQQGNAGRGQ